MAARGSLRAGWASYAALATVGYLLYGLGSAVPYLRAQLGLSETEVGLHSSALAAGIVLAGSVAAGLDRRLGELAVRAAAIAILLAALVVLAAAPAIGATLAAAGLMGLGCGTLLGYANAALGVEGGRAARLGLARGNVWAIVAAFVGPFVFAIGASVGPGWWLGLAPALILLGILAIDLRAGPRLAPPDREGPRSSRLPRGYWPAWAFLVAAISLEFSIVFWGATLVERRTGVATPDATAIAALFLGGMFTGRLGLAVGAGAGDDLRRNAAAGLALAVVGAVAAWVSTSPLLSAGALFLAGLGMAILYPLGVAAALARAPGQLALAGNRLTLASGLAIFVAPLALGAIADATGVVAGWTLVLGLAAVAYALLFVVRPEPLPTGDPASSPGS